MVCNPKDQRDVGLTYIKGLKHHKLFPQVEEIFQTGATISLTEMSELMISNRGSPGRVLKSVITALQINGDSRLSSTPICGKTEIWLAAEDTSSLAEASSVFVVDNNYSVPIVKEIQKLSPGVQVRRISKSKQIFYGLRRRPVCNYLFSCFALLTYILFQVKLMLHLPSLPQLSAPAIDIDTVVDVEDASEDQHPVGGNQLVSQPVLYFKNLVDQHPVGSRYITMQIVNIEDLHETNPENAVEVRVIRRWVTRLVPDETCYIFADKHADGIHAVAAPSYKSAYDSALAVQGCYRILCFSCDDPPTYLKTVDRPVSLRFGSTATVTPLEDSLIYPKLYFDFTEYENLVESTPTVDVFTDFIGLIDHVVDAKTQDNAPYIRLFLKDGRNNITATLWKEIIVSAERFNRTALDTTPRPCTIAVTSVKVTKHKGVFLNNSISLLSS
ncbi:hypothetical protein SSX86_023127 [Deinandra increscens subsp. villosa]|uniref:Uncharacterized protein n=1 Tax=Deinandra increscens subsp. villosa TaxID=3103831 RepID=A0AAP0GRT5_9ASTR